MPLARAASVYLNTNRGSMKHLAFLAAAIIFVLSLFLLACSLNSPGHPYLSVSTVGVCLSGVVLGKLLLDDRRMWHE